MAAEKTSRKRIDKTGIVVGILITVALIATLFFYLINTGDIELKETFMVVIVGIIIVFALYILWDRSRNIRLGLPAKDEMERRISWRAGYYGFIAAIWGAVFGPVVIDIIFGYELDGSRVTELVVIVSGLVFAASYLYFRKKGIGD